MNGTYASDELSDDTAEGAPTCVAVSPTLVPALTILCHPDTARVGQVARLGALQDGGAALSRGAPVFAHPGETAASALADRGVSRRPLSFVRAGDGLRIVVTEGSSVQLDGVPLMDVTECSWSRLADGVVLELGSRVALLLHLLPLPTSRPPRLGLVGENPAIERVREDILRVADLPVPVLIRGETGTGKELVARAVHAASPRRERPCVCVNVATLTESMAVSQLFGHRRGAFTGATHDQPGLLVTADGGTLFLDEVGEAPPAVQAMLLRVLETGEVQALGASAPRRVDVRLVSATDADLEARTKEGRFSSALLHRLAGYRIPLPPLRHRRDDLGRLIFHFLREELAIVGEAHRLAPSDREAPPWMPTSLVARLVRYDWPGNVRQLRNVVRQLVISSRGASCIRVDDTVEGLLAEVTAGPTATPRLQPAPPRRPAEITDEELVACLRAHGWRREPAARALGISATTLYTRIERCPLIRKATELSADELRGCWRECDGDLERMSERLEVSVRGLQLRLRELGLKA